MLQVLLAVIARFRGDQSCSSPLSMHRATWTSVGLSSGYVTKYSVDRRSVFVSAAAA